MYNSSQETPEDSMAMNSSTSLNPEMSHGEQMNTQPSNIPTKLGSDTMNMEQASQNGDNNFQLINSQIGVSPEIGNVSIVNTQEKDEEEKLKLQAEIDSLKMLLFRTNEFMNRQITDGPKTGSVLMKKILELEDIIKKLENEAATFDRRLREMWECKESHKLRELTGIRFINNILKKHHDEREKDTVIKQRLADENATIADNMMIAEAELREKDEKFDDMMKKHKEERARALEVYEVQSCKDNKTILQQKMFIDKMETVAKRANNLFTRRMKQENGLRTEAEKDVVEKQIKIQEYEEKMKSQNKELRIWSKINRLFWEIEPENPETTNIPDLTLTPSNTPDTDSYDSTSSIEPNDTLVEMDTIQADNSGLNNSCIDNLQTRDPSPIPDIQNRDPSPNPEASVKRRKICNKKQTRRSRSYSSSRERERSRKSKDDRQKRQCRNRVSEGMDLNREIRILKKQSENDREQLLKDRLEMDNLRKEVNKLNTSLKEKEKEIEANMENKKSNKEDSETQTEKYICKIAETQTEIAQVNKVNSRIAETQTEKVQDSTLTSTETQTEAVQDSTLTSTSEIGRVSERGDRKVQTSEIGRISERGDTETQTITQTQI